jgi:hypothetical protein
MFVPVREIKRWIQFQNATRVRSVLLNYVIYFQLHIVYGVYVLVSIRAGIWS